MKDDIQDKIIQNRSQKILKERKQILSLPAEKALERILEAPQPAAIVHSFPEEDLYFLIHDIGVEDSLALLSLASAKQWEYILDLEIWEKDRIDINAITKWLDFLLKAAPKRLVTWLLDEKIEFLELYLFRNIEIRIREHDQDPSIFGKEFFTLDDTIYVKFIDYPYDNKSDKKEKKQREALLLKLLKHLASLDHLKYQKVLLESGGIIPAESEEEFWRMRNVRLAEKGFLPFDEAIGIYQPLAPPQIIKRQKKHLPAKTEHNTFYPVPLYSFGMLKADNPFSRTLSMIDIIDAFWQIQTEFAGLCNQIISADQKTIRDREELRGIVKKASGYISIGLERLAEDKTEASPKQTEFAGLIQQYPLIDIFRVGYALAHQLKRQAEKWKEKSWFVKNNFSLGFWGEEWLGVLGGLLIKKPLFYDNYKTGELYREFESLDDIKKTETVLRQIMAFDNLLSVIGIALKPLPSVFLTYKNFVLTLWARHYLGISENLKPLTLDEFKQFFNALFKGSSKSDIDKPHKISKPMKEAFLIWLSEKAGIEKLELIRGLGQTFENLFGEIESEYGQVAMKDLDPKYIHLFWVISP